MKSLGKELIAIWLSVFVLAGFFALQMLFQLPRKLWGLIKFPAIFCRICYDSACECKNENMECSPDFDNQENVQEE